MEKNFYKNEELKQYFQEKYEKCGFRVVPGHWPNFQSKKEIDDWFENRKRLMKMTLEEEAD